MTTTDHPIPPSTLPPPPAGPPPLPRPPDSTRRTVVLVFAAIVLALVALAGVACVSSEIDDVGRRVDAEENDSQDDARVDRCLTHGDSTHAVLSITNDTSGDSTYIVEVQFLDGAGHERDRAEAFLDGVRPGTSAAAELVGPAGTRCHVAHVERFAS